MQFPNLQFYFAAGLAVLLKEIPKHEAQRERETKKPAPDTSQPPAEYQQTG
jgi:hypothetical protein